MRISTSQFYDAGALNIQRNQSALYKLQNQLSTGRRVLTPADDPVAAAQALLVSQNLGVNAQHTANQGAAASELGLVDSQLSTMVDLLQDVRDRLVQASSTGTVSSSDRAAIASELESRLGEMVGIANSQNGSGDYLFSGYQGATAPFAIDGGSGAYRYFGDDGERLLQVSSSRQLAINVAGSEVFMNVKGGNGTFVAAPGGNGPGINQGTATIDAGSVLDPQKWVQGVNNSQAGQPLEVRFADVGGVMSYGIYDPVGGLGSPLKPFTPGQAIPLVTANGVDFGAQVVVKGQPAAGDTFSVTPSSGQSVFQTVQSVIGLLRTPLGTSALSTTEFANQIGAQLTNLDRGFDNLTRVQANVGTRLRELDSLSNLSADLNLQYESNLVDLQGLDFAKAISDFTLQRTYLEAAQSSFAQISRLSLFNYL
ncbi:MAG: flagellar hook-associated protein FlgL [Propionivibrio sp.]